MREEGTRFENGDMEYSMLKLIHLNFLREETLPNILKELVRYEIDIAAIQKVQWIGNNTMEKRDHTIFCSCDTKDHILGIEFIVCKRVKHVIRDFRAITPRMCLLRLRTCLQL